jgi:hypothetical protein
MKNRNSKKRKHKSQRQKYKRVDKLDCLFAFISTRVIGEVLTNLNNEFLKEVSIVSKTARSLFAKDAEVRKELETNMKQLLAIYFRVVRKIMLITHQSSLIVT